MLIGITFHVESRNSNPRRVNILEHYSNYVLPHVFDTPEILSK